METIEFKCEMKGKGVCPLPLEDLINIIRNKWSLSLIITIGNFEKLHFNSIHRKLKDRHVKKITSKILSARLKDLEKSGMVRREKSIKYPYTVNYSLTERGKKFYKIFLEIDGVYKK